MNLEQVGMLVLEATVMSVIILGLFRLRTLLGLTPLYIVLGGFQYLESVFSLRVRITPNFVLFPASTVLFVTSVVTVLLIYVKEDAIEARKLVYGLVLANAAVSTMSLILAWHMTLPGSELGNFQADFGLSAWISLVGTSLLFLDVIGIILAYEFFSNLVRGLFLRFFLSVMVIVIFDNIVFTLIVQAGKANLLRIMMSGIVGKVLAGMFYSFAFWLYLRYVEPRIGTAGTGDVADVFQALTYRQKYEQARQRMVRDSLTGLYNRGYFDEILPTAMAHAERYNEPLSLMLVDTDNFKTINDQMSHLEGDKVLRLIAETLAAEARAADVACRFGGDEFVVLLAQSNAAAAHACAERFQMALTEKCRAADPPRPWGLITTTIGIATYPGDPGIVTHADLIRIADARLYAGKHAGRNRVVSMA